MIHHHYIKVGVVRCFRDVRVRKHGPYCIQRLRERDLLLLRCCRGVSVLLGIVGDLRRREVTDRYVPGPAFCIGE